MYIFGCEDTTTIIMDYLKRKETRSLLCVNKNFNNIRNNGYHSIRVIQDFIRKNKKIKCHENKYNCRKITLTELLNNSEKYIEKTIQFIIPFKKTAYKPGSHTLWHCKFGGIFRYSDFQWRQPPGILIKHVGHINLDIYPKSSSEYPIIKLDKEDTFTFFGQKYKIYEYSIRIID